MGKKFNLGLMTKQYNQMTEIPGDALVTNTTAIRENNSMTWWKA